MSPPRLLLDRGLPRSTAALLRAENGWDVVHIGERELARATDAELLELARSEKRVRLTFDADFHAVLALSGAAKPSTIRIRIEGLDACGLAQLLRRILRTVGAAPGDGAAVTVNEHSVRVRRLPIGAETREWRTWRPYRGALEQSKTQRAGPGPALRACCG